MTISPDAALVVEGGAMRGVFSTGLLDGFLEQGFDPFAMGIGVSAGAGNLAAYRARMHGRNLKIYTDYSLRPEFMNLKRFLYGGHLMDLDWLWRTTIAEIRLDLDTIYADPGRPLIVCLADVRTGEAVYRKTEAADLEPLLKASSAMPILYRTFPRIDGRPMADGGLVDPLPVGEAIRRGARRIMVIRSRPSGYEKKEGLIQYTLNWQLRCFPHLKEAMANRVKGYNETVALIRRPPPGITITEICPPDTFRSSRLSRDPRILLEGYEQGRALSGEAIAAWERNTI